MKNVLVAYWPSIRRYRFLLCVTLVMLVIGVFLDILYPYIIREFVNVFAVESPDIPLAERFLWLLAILLIVQKIVWHLGFDYAIVFFQARVMRDLDERSFNALQMQSMRFFESSFSGSLVKQVTRFRESFEGLADAFFFQIGRDFLLISMTFVIFVWELPQIAWAFGVWIILFLTSNFLLALWKFPLDVAEAKADTAISGALADSLGNHSTVKSYGMERHEQTRFDAVVHTAYVRRIRAWVMSNHITLFQSIFMGIFQIILIWIMIRGFEKGTVTVGDFVFFQSYVLWLFGNLWNFGNTIRRVFQYVADATEMANVYAMIAEVQDLPDAKQLEVADGAVQFTNVDFSYSGVMTPENGEIHGLNLAITPRESLAVVGPTGAGKTTLVKLLMRYFDILDGSIEIDGQNIAQVTQESLRQQIALVPQSPELFHRTLRDNIAFARPEATEEEIIAAAKRAHAWEFISKLPEGMDTFVGERGVKLSGGERQRIALARAFLANARIMILDEATSALDSETEKFIQESIADLLRDRTSIVIAHRLSTIMMMDRIVVVDDGRISEMGTHDELLAQKGTYHTLWSHQSGGYIG